MPLDLADSVLMDTPESILKARGNLDADGWSKDRVINPASRQRVQLMLCMLREEALELKLGPVTPDIEAKAQRVLRKLKSTWQSIPSHMKYNKASQWAGQLHIAINLQSLWLERLYTEFILHTILASSTELNRERLITTAHEIVNTVLLPTRRRDLLHSHRADIEWALVFYAMPCTSVLVLELLRQEQHPAEQLRINRSGVIQDISILISCCGSWTEAGQSNYQICKQAQSIFSKSLDSILNHTQHIPRDSSEEVTAHQQEHYHEVMRVSSPENFNGLAQDPEWMAWLESVGLQGDLWLESSIPTSEFYD
ncbi:uncharacterized protein N7496_012761 [Penicillium cataractarum]|uniref:Transcription factor domain-containing protein n=1 Tax=Penicillium cataractarum TaxID=2100454 RepID=A0A9W9RB30_9EURO|nr:uncharacterized protein N7496_012761 [Penicillium cataractarum]KAJ5355549.1 hypothetical protein N7496_012761 [Penicillium cataractarum]